MTLKSSKKQAAVVPDAVVKPRRRAVDRGVAGPVVQKSVSASAVVEKKPAAAPASSGVRRGRSNRRSEQTIVNILQVTENIILQSGAERILILDVCREADISRGTFYRYFASQDELLDAFSRHKREQFHVSLAEAVKPYEDPDERFAAVIRYLDNYLEQGLSRRLLIAAPSYALGFFRRIFHDAVVRFQDVLSSVFDAWEVRYGVQVDRELVCELLIRYVLSEHLVPGDSDRKSVTRRIGRMVEALAAGTSPRARR